MYSHENYIILFLKIMVLLDSSINCIYCPYVVSWMPTKNGEHYLLLLPPPCDPYAKTNNNQNLERNPFLNKFTKMNIIYSL